MSEYEVVKRKAIPAGILIGIGVIINLNVEPPILGAILFSFGLLVIIKLQLNLYTGMIGFLKSGLLETFFYNLIGIAFTTGLYAVYNPIIISTYHAVAQSKFSKSCVQLFLAGIFCGMLIHFAVKCKDTVITIFAITIFILIGAEHCIADFPFLLYSFSLLNIIKYLLIVLGNSLGALLIERFMKWKESQLT